MRRGALAVAAGLIVAAALFLWARQVPSAPTDPTPTAVAPLPDAATKWAAPVTPHGQKSLRGIVKRHGAPVAGASVTALADRPPLGLSAMPRCPHSTEACPEDDGEDFLRAVEDRSLEGEPLGRAITDANGAFELTGLGDEALTLWAERDDALGSKVGVLPGPTPVELELHQGRTVRGTVKHSDGSAAEGALVTVITDRAVRFFEVVVRPDGSFEVGPVPRSNLALVASEPGFLPMRVIISPEREGPISIELLPPRTVSGVVREGGTPVAGAEVRLSGRSERISRTSEKGAFLFDRVRPGSYDLRATSRESIAETSLQVSGSEDPTVTLELQRGTFFRGVVVDDRGASLAGATVSLDDHETTSDARGAFALGPVIPGEARCELLATRRGYLSSSIDCDAPELRLVLPRASTIKGRVIAPDGSPAAAFQVFALRVVTGDDDPSRGNFMLADGLDGGFELDVRPGTWDLEVHSPFLTARTEATAPGQVTVKLESGLELKGVFLDARGQPVLGARIMASMAGGEPTGAMTDEDGRFTLTQLKPGRWSVTARKMTLEQTVNADGEAAAGSPTELVLRAAPGAVIAGTVVSAEGEPIGAATITAFSTAGRHRTVGTAVSDDAGVFSIDSLPEGPFSLRARADRRQVSVEGTAPDEHLVVAFLAEAVLVGRVVDERGQPFKNFSISGVRQETADGRFTWPVAVEKQSVPFAADGVLRKVVVLDPRAGRNDLGDVVLLSGPTLTGVVTDEPGRPLSGAMVRSSEEGGTVTDGRGGFSLMVDRAATRLSVSHPSYVTWSGPISHTTEPLSIVLSRGATVTVRPTNSKGQPAESLTVALKRGDEVRFAEPRRDGRYVANAIEPGTWTIEVSSHATNDVFRPTSVEIGKADVELELKPATDGAAVRFEVDALMLFFVEGDETSMGSSPPWGTPLQHGRAEHVLPGVYTVIAIKQGPGKSRLVSRTLITVTDAPQQTFTLNPTTWSPVP